MPVTPVHTTYRVTVANRPESFLCREDEMVLEAMKRAQCGPIYGCFGGGCGICKMQIRSGDYHIAKRMSRAHVSQAEQAQGIVLLCCVQPRGDLFIVPIS